MGKEEKLREWFGECPGALVAFSGGVDSSLVAFLARRFLGEARTLAVISASPSLKTSELEAGKQFALEERIPLRVIATRELENPDYFTNPANRCYFCKQTLYTEMGSLRTEFPGWWVLNGTNLDDAGDYRPGLQAAAEQEVRSPLLECGIDKAGVRELAAGFALRCWDKPASPCLSSRVPYGERITLRKLQQIEDAEEALKRRGFPVNRVRHLGETARIEVPSDLVEALLADQDGLAAELAVCGFGRIEVDPEGFVSGKLNRAIGR